MDYFSELQRKNGGVVISMVAAVITALFSLAGVIYVHTKTERQIEERRRQDNEQKEKQIQLRAVAEYYTDVYSLNLKWRKHRDETMFERVRDLELFKLVYREVGTWYQNTQAVYAKTRALYLFLYEEKLDLSMASLFDITANELDRSARAWDELTSISQEIIKDPTFVEAEEFRVRAKKLWRSLDNDFSRNMHAQLDNLANAARKQFGLRSDLTLRELKSDLPRYEGPYWRTDPSNFGLGEY